MSNSIAPGSSADVNVKVTALTTNPNVPVTYKTIILKKNLVNGVNTLTQEMMSATNTKYIVKYDYVLGENITVPANCVLEFDGGSLSNGTLINAAIDNPSNSVILKNITIVTPKRQLVYLKWFDYTSFADAFENAAKFEIVNADGEWTIDRKVTIENNIELYNGKFNCFPDFDYNVWIKSPFVSEELSYSGTIAAESNSIDKGIVGDYDYLMINGSDDFYRQVSPNNRHGKVGEIMKIKSLTQNTTEFDQSSRLVCSYTSDIKLKYFKPIEVIVRNCKFNSTITNRFKEDGCSLLYIQNSIATINNCDFSGASQGCSLNACYNSSITHCRFKNICWSTAFNDGTSKSFVTSCIFNFTKHAWTSLGEKYVVKDCIISNNIASNGHIPFCSHCNAYGIVYEGNHISDSRGGIGSMAPNSVISNNVIERTYQEIDENTQNNIAMYAIYLLEAGAFNCVVSDNIVKDSKSNAISITLNPDDLYSQLTNKYITFKNNSVLNCVNAGGVSIDLGDKTSNETFNDPVVQVTNNVFSVIGWSGIYITGVRQLIIQGNSLYTSTRNKIAINVNLNASRKSYSYCILTNNRIVGFGNTTDGIISVQNFANVLYDSNYANKDGDYPINFVNSTVVRRNELIIQYPNVDDLPTLTSGNVGCTKFISNLGVPVWRSNNNWVESDGASAGIKRSGTFAEKPNSNQIYVGYKYFCTDKQTTEGATDGIEIIHKGNNVWVDALGRIVS